MGYGTGGYGRGGYGVMTQTTSVTITLEEQGELTVQVDDADGAGIDGATVTLSGASGSVSEEATTDENGQVVFDGIPIADYTVSAEAMGYFADEASVAAGDFT